MASTADAAKACAYIQSNASWSSKFSVYTEHMYNGVLRHATLEGPTMGDAKVSTSTKAYALSDTACAGAPVTSFTIPSDEAYIDIPVKVTSTTTLLGTYMACSQIQDTFVSFGGSGFVSKDFASTGKTAISELKSTKRIYKSNYATPGTYYVSLAGDAHTTSIYNDDIYASTNGSSTVSIMIPDAAKPYIDLTASVTVPADGKKTVTGTSDETVTVVATATIKNFSDAVKVKNWHWYGRLAENTVSDVDVSLSGGSLASSKVFTFTVNKSKLAKDFIQDIVITAQADFTADVTDKSRFRINPSTGNACLTATKNLAAGFVLPTSDAAEETTTPGYPTAIISAPKLVEAGQMVAISGSGSHSPNGAITDYSWTMPGAAAVISGASGSVYYPGEGPYMIDLFVTDEAGMGNFDTEYIKVTPPLPTAVIWTSGALKENRRFTVSAEGSFSQTAYPIKDSLTSWSITPVSGGAASDIKYDGLLAGSKTKDMLIRTAGTYLVKLTVYNTAGYSDTETRLITIEDDLPPVAAFSVADTVLRDPAGGGTAAIIITDKSCSNDGDTISSRTWAYYYDSDNDGLFTDETAVKTFDSGSTTSLTYYVSEVGNYLISLTVKEGFGQETIPAFVSNSDYLTGFGSKTSECINNAPVSSFALVKRQKADISVVTDYTGTGLTSLAASLATLKASAYSNNVDLNYTINDGSSGVKVGEVFKSKRLTANKSRIMWSNSYRGTYGYQNNNIGFYVTSTGTVSRGNNKPSNIVAVDECKGLYAAIDSNGVLYAYGSDGTGLFSPLPMLTDGSQATTWINYRNNYTQIGGNTYYPDSNNYVDVGCTDGCVWGLTSGGVVTMKGTPQGHYVFSGGGSSTYYYGNSFTSGTGFTDIETSYTQGLMLKNDGTVWALGDSTYRTCGVTTKDNMTPALGTPKGFSQIGGLSGIKKIFISQQTGFAIDSGNNVWAWGKVEPELGISATDYMLSYGMASYIYNCTQTPQKLTGLNGSDIIDIQYGSVGVVAGNNAVYSTQVLKILKADGTLWSYNCGKLTQIINDYYSVYDSYRGKYTLYTLTLGFVVAIGDDWWLNSAGTCY
ncbi:MAG: hypothetical protein HGA22_02350 [Clostridiales bacterium]|nr:hypothetical protein [Clostridiales bacterium]